MARVKVTPQNINAKLLEWKNNTNITDVLVYLPSEGIDETAIVNLGWANSVVIEIKQDVGVLRSFTYKEKLT